MAKNMSTVAERNVGADVEARDGTEGNPDAILLSVAALRKAAGGGSGDLVRQSDLPDEFIATVEDVEHVKRDDERGRIERINVYVKLQDGRRALITWPKSTWGFVADQLEMFGLFGVAEMVGHTFRFRRFDVGRVRYRRHFPFEKIV